MNGWCSLPVVRRTTVFTIALAISIGCGDSQDIGGGPPPVEPEGDIPDGEGLSPAGIVEMVEVPDLPGNGMIAPAWDDFQVPIGGASNWRPPRGMYSAACGDGESPSRYFVSFNVESGSDEALPEDGELGPLVQETWWHGALLEASVDASGSMAPVMAQGMDECIEMRGIVAAPDCSFVAALCMRAIHTSETEPFTRDLVAESENPDALYNPRNGGTHPDELWLYEWANADLQSEPEKFVIHKSAGSSWHYMNYRLVLADTNTYGVLSKAYRGGHEGSSMLVIDREADAFTDRTRTWGACAGGGHPLFGFLAHNPATGRFAAHCGGDWDDGEGGDPVTPMRGIRIEGEGAFRLYRTIPQRGQTRGAPGGIVPLDDGGYLLAFTTVPDEPETSHLLGPKWEHYNPDVRTVAGLMRIGPSGDVVWGPRYQRYPEGGSEHGGWITNARLTDLGNGRYLFGYAHALMENADNPIDPIGGKDGDIPFEYVLYEVDADGNRVSESLLASDMGWGPQDEAILLEPGRVAWPYIPNPTYDLGTNSWWAFSGGPPLNSSVDRLALYVYQSSAG